MIRRLALAVIATVALTGCSQIAALTPVGGDSITSVRNAVYDVLVDQQVPIMVAPQCETVDSGFTCVGSTVDGAEIRAEAGSTAPYPLTITVGGEQIFSGDAQQVLDAALLEGS
ncbi:MAG: hypothetical protein VW362_05680 [Candidatus Nanopelagicales bacterium]|jgi:hypothetical protein